MMLCSRTGQKCIRAGDYIFDRYVRLDEFPSSLLSGLTIPMELGEVFPPESSSGLDAYWIWMR